MPTPAVARPHAPRALALAATGAGLLAACARAPRPTPPAPAAPPERVGLPPVPRVTGPLSVRVAWPPEGNVLTGRDSTFVFGSVGSGDAVLTVNGARVAVAPNGAFLGFVPVPPPSAPRYEFVAARGADTARRTVPVRVAAPRSVPAAGPLVVDSASASPRGRLACLWPAVLDFCSQSVSNAREIRALQKMPKVQKIASASPCHRPLRGGRFPALSPVQTPFELFFFSHVPNRGLITLP
jgi:hypothetical protein